MLLGVVLAVLLGGCAGAPEFSAYHGPDVVTGRGGTSQMRNGIEVWDNGTPPRRYRILGVMESQGGGHSDIGFETDQLAKAAKKMGADAIIIMQADAGVGGINLYSGRFMAAPRVKAVAIKYL